MATQSTISLNDLWIQDEQGLREFNGEEMKQLWTLLQKKLLTTLATFHILGRVAYEVPLLYDLKADKCYIATIKRFDTIYQSFVACRKIYGFVNPRPSEEEFLAAQEHITKAHVQYIGSHDKVETFQCWIWNNNAKILLLKQCIKLAFRYARAAEIYKVDFFRLLSLIADEAIVEMRQIYLRVKSFLHGPGLSHEWLAKDLQALGVAAEVAEFLKVLMPDD
ncbi:MAG: hypothetical protein M1820_005057 [Bogoriella megaspora]|nr:MAG: hypothetical protein M1820_005057 [Bogoriella megaspora]